MTSPPSTEQFLRTFHDHHPGKQSESIRDVLTPGGRTAYETFADHVGSAERVLDLGCADGELLSIFAARGAHRLAGIDLSLNELAFARRRPELANAELRLGRAQELPWDAGAFDAVVSHMAFMVMSDPEAVAAEAARVLAPGGRFAVAVGSGGAEAGDAIELFRSLAVPLFRAARAKGLLPKFGDRRPRTREGLDEILGPAGFAPMAWERITIRHRGTPARVWQDNVATFYEMSSVPADEVARLRERFLAEAEKLAVDGVVPWAMGIDVATTRLVGAGA
ncbi:bifunctional 2-polyprenyl-6-hydroxyphenol methylase/3-demethylubiquinol 3-O-methyltransferase UbiG [Amycolatopsis sp. FDAARGOS 1241]|uniref:class I SAM-dependent methyltransferase n=1 Tax=Amycolatopsis sp. FDAARGOS 1241 TaxID=2778070 RepID=UPI00194FEC76|nr:class I SAM-dependent methyltransferase [Amycolatopsis sp. FDAARGOS 1241]QRP45209.1 methyltransferase domain-containing protein [Amycolatopsis sp. FDAARGOS 1241]